MSGSGGGECTDKNKNGGKDKPALPQIGPTPDTSYKPVARAPERLPLRPIVIGMGPCGLFAGLVLAQMGFRPIILERGKAVRERTVDTFGLVAQENPQPGIERAVRRRRRRHVLRRQALQPDQRQAPPRPQGADRVRRGRRAGGNPLRQQAAHRHVPAGVDGRAHARDDRIAGRRDPLLQPRRRPAGGDRCRRHAPRARRGAGRWFGTARRPRGHGARPQRARHLRDAARTRRVPRSQTLLDRLPHRAPAIADRPPRASGRRPGIRCSARPTTSWCTTAATAVRSTVSACARAAPWSRRRASRGAWSPTA